MFESFDEVFVDLLGFSSGLFLKPAALDVGIVELGVAGGDFLPIDDEFVDVDHRGVFRILFGKGNELGVNVSDEAGVEGMFFD